MQTGTLSTTKEQLTLSPAPEMRFPLIDKADRSSAFHVPYKWKVLLTVALSMTMCTMDFSIMNLALPVLVKSLNTDLTTAIWISLIYSLVITSLMLILGKISDLFGRKKIFTTGIAIFTIGLLACSLAPSIGQLIALRILQAFGAAMVISCGPAIVTDAFPPGELGKGIGLLGASASLGFIIGPILGGLILRWFAWPAIFYMRLPLGIIIFFMAMFIFKKEMPVGGKVRFDIPGTLTSSMGLFLLVLGVSQVYRMGLGSPIILIIITVGILCLTFFILIERKSANPVVDLSLFREQAFSISILCLFLIFVATPAFLLIMPFYLMEGIGLSSSEAGLLLAVTAIISVIISPFSGSLSDRFGSRWFLVLGAFATLISYLLMMCFDLHSGISFITSTMILMGIGIGTFHSPNNSTIMGAVPGDRRGTASALMATVRSLGMALGMAFTSTIYTARKLIYESSLLEQGIDARYADSFSIPQAFHDTLLVSILFQLAVMILSFSQKITLHRKKRL